MKLVDCEDVANQGSIRLALDRLAHVELELPAAIVARVLLHQSSRVPTSVTWEWSRTGTVSPEVPSSLASAVSRGAISSSSSACQRSRIRPTGSSRRVVEPRNRNSAGSANDQAKLGAGDVAFGPLLHSHRDHAEGP